MYIVLTVESIAFLLLGEGCLDSIRSFAATFGEETPRKTEDEEEGEEEVDEEGSRGSSQLSRELINTTVESALQV
jgi:hypothetical protein